LQGLLLFSEQALLKFTRDKIISELRKKGQTAILYELPQALSVHRKVNDEWVPIKAMMTVRGQVVQM